MTRNRIVSLSFVVAISTLAPPAFAQIASRSTLTLEGARKVIAAAVAEARARNAPGGVIAVVDDGGNLMALERLDNTFAAGALISIGKARTAVLFKRPTRVFEDIIKNGRTAMVALEDFTPLQGGVPVVVNGQVVGGVGVSGAASGQQDEELAIAGANALSATSPDQEPVREAVLYFPKDRVTASFAAGGVLVGAEDSNQYMVHTSRRDRPGQAEVHARDTDIIYVTHGQATFVTGGTVVDGKPTAEDELRGSAIGGGETRTLAAGDVVIVPNGVPHWFKAVNGPFNYYVVKVRSETAAPKSLVALSLPASGGQR